MRHVPVLVWHKVDRRREPGITVVSPERFRLQVEALGGARSLSLDEYLGRGGMQEDSERCCLLCFDDAYESVEREAFPVLRQAGLQGALFPPTAWIGGWNRWDRGLLGRMYRHLDEAGIARLLGEGWSLGLHGHSHRRLDGCGLEALEREIVDARATLELTFGVPVKVVAWPFGRCDRRAVRVAEAAGLRAGFGHAPAGLAAHPMCRPRLAVYPLHGARRMREMLAGSGPDALQRLAARGARLSGWLAGSPPGPGRLA